MIGDVYVGLSAILSYKMYSTQKMLDRKHLRRFFIYYRQRYYLETSLIYAADMRWIEQSSKTTFSECLPAYIETWLFLFDVIKCYFDGQKEREEKNLVSICKKR